MLKQAGPRRTQRVLSTSQSWICPERCPSCYFVSQSTMTCLGCCRRVVLGFCQWLETEFLRYLEEWESAVQNNREGVTPAQRSRCCRNLNRAQTHWYADTHTYMLTHNYVCIHMYVYVRTKFAKIITHTCTYFDPQLRVSLSWLRSC